MYVKCLYPRSNLKLLQLWCSVDVVEVFVVVVLIAPIYSIKSCIILHRHHRFDDNDYENILSDKVNIGRITTANDNRNNLPPELLNALAWHNKSSGKISRMGSLLPVVGSWQVFERALCKDIRKYKFRIK